MTYTGPPTSRASDHLTICRAFLIRSFIILRFFVDGLFAGIPFALVSFFTERGEKILWKLGAKFGEGLSGLEIDVGCLGV